MGCTIVAASITGLKEQHRALRNQAKDNDLVRAVANGDGGEVMRTIIPDQAHLQRKC